MELGIQTTYDAPLVKRASFQFWKRKQGSDAVIAPLVFLLVSYFFFIEQHTSWYVGFFLAVSLIYLLTVYAVLYVCRKRSLALFKSMGENTAKWKFTESNISCESGAGKAELNWSSIIQLWKLSEVWLLVYANETYSTLPVVNLNHEVQELIQKKVLEHGGKIT